MVDLAGARYPLRDSVAVFGRTSIARHSHLYNGQNLSPQPVDAMGDLLDHQEAPHTWSWTGHFAQFLPMQAVSLRKSLHVCADLPAVSHFRCIRRTATHTALCSQRAVLAPTCAAAAWHMPKPAVRMLPTGDTVHPLSLQSGQESAGRAWLLAAQLQPVQPDPGAGPRAGNLHHERLPKGLLTWRVHRSGPHDPSVPVASHKDRFRF